MKEIIEENNLFKIYQNNFIFKMLFLIFIILYGDLILCYYNNKIKTFKFILEHPFNDFQINKQIDLDYENKYFAVIKRASSPNSGLFSNYIRFLGCIRKYIIQGFIPIFELESYKNTINGFVVDPLKGNPWEYYFNQPFSYKYDDIKNKAKNIKYFDCKPKILPNFNNFLNTNYIRYWRIMAKAYMPIKKQIIKESNNIMKKIFKGKKNILGVLLRGTDYLARKPRNHPIPPNTEDVIKDVKLLDDKYKYDWIFLSTEDNIIRKEFIRGIGIKVKCLLSKKQISYNYKKKKLIGYYINNKKNIEYNKIYLLNILILSKCLDFLGAKTNGTIGVFILTKGFRNYKVYNLGVYK